MSLPADLKETKGCFSAEAGCITECIRQTLSSLSVLGCCVRRQMICVLMINLNQLGLNKLLYYSINLGVKHSCKGLAEYNSIHRPRLVFERVGYKTRLQNVVAMLI